MLVMIVRQVRVALEAEENHQAYTHVLDLLIAYVSTHKGEWPRSWDDLTNVRLDNSRSMFEWPRDAEKVRVRVQVRFDVTASDVAEMNLQRFSAVRPNSPNYGVDVERIEVLQREIRQHARSDK